MPYGKMLLERSKGKNTKKTERMGSVKKIILIIFLILSSSCYGFDGHLAAIDINGVVCIKYKEYDWIAYNSRKIPESRITSDDKFIDAVVARNIDVGIKDSQLSAYFSDGIKCADLRIVDNQLDGVSAFYEFGWKKYDMQFSQNKLDGSVVVYADRNIKKTQFVRVVENLDVLWRDLKNAEYIICPYGDVNNEGRLYKFTGSFESFMLGDKYSDDQRRAIFEILKSAASSERIVARNTYNKGRIHECRLFDDDTLTAMLTFDDDGGIFLEKNFDKKGKLVKTINWKKFFKEMIEKREKDIQRVESLLSKVKYYNDYDDIIKLLGQPRKDPSQATARIYGSGLVTWYIGSVAVQVFFEHGYCKAIMINEQPFRVFSY